MQGAVRIAQDVSTRRNSHALAGCFAGFFVAGSAGERFGGRRVLLASAVPFARDCVHSSRNLRRWNNTDVRHSGRSKEAQCRHIDFKRATSAGTVESYIDTQSRCPVPQSDCESSHLQLQVMEQLVV